MIKITKISLLSIEVTYHERQTEDLEIMNIFIPVKKK